MPERCQVSTFSARAPRNHRCCASSRPLPHTTHTYTHFAVHLRVAHIHTQPYTHTHIPHFLRALESNIGFQAALPLLTFPQSAKNRPASDDTHRQVHTRKCTHIGKCTRAAATCTPTRTLLPRARVKKRHAPLRVLPPSATVCVKRVICSNTIQT